MLMVLEKLKYGRILTMKKNRTIYLMRHGLDDERFIGGWSNGSLIEEGIKQVEQSTDFIIKNIKDITAIYNSGIRRTIETSEIVNTKINLPIFVLDDLKELNKGKLNGIKKELAKEKYPEYFPNPPIDKRYPDGESLLDLYNRVKKFLENIDDIDDYDNTLFVTHRGFINMLYFIINDMEINYNKTQFNVVHGSIHKLESNKISRIF